MSSLLTGWLATGTLGILATGHLEGKMLIHGPYHQPSTRLKAVNLQDRNLHATNYKLHGHMLQTARYMVTRLLATSLALNSLVAPRGPADSTAMIPQTRIPQSGFHRQGAPAMIPQPFLFLVLLFLVCSYGLCWPKNENSALLTFARRCQTGLLNGNL